MTDLPLVPGEVTGFRRFRVGEDGLLPAHVGTLPWTSPVAHARCRRSRHAAPAPGCSCGLHAWHTLADARAHALPREVTAVVRGSGRVVLGEHGWRAERASVVAVALPPRATSTRARRDRVADVVRRHHPEARLCEERELEDYRADDLTALGVDVRPSPAVVRGWGPWWAIGVLAGSSLALWGGAASSVLRSGGWVALVVALVLWQAFLVRGAAVVPPSEDRPRC